MPLLPAEKNFADLRETVVKLLALSPDENIKRLIELVGEIAFRCDNLEREVERQGRLLQAAPR